jgi:lipopolysaccharide transport system permease protein
VSRGPVVKITPANEPWHEYLRELWTHRELLFFLVWRDLTVRYKQTLLGFGWAILQPVATALVFTLFLGRLAGVPSDGLPYALFAFVGLVPWTLFASGVTQAGNSLVASESLITKTYLPRIMIPVASVFAGTMAFVVNLLLAGLLAIWYGEFLHWKILWLVPLTLLVLSATTGVGLLLSALNVRFRDVHHILPFLIQIWMFATPIVYPSSLVQDRWRVFYALNPMAGAVDGFRWALLDSPIGAFTIPISSCVAVALLVIGFAYFRRQECEFADII